MAQSAVIRGEFDYTGHNAVIHTLCYNPQLETFVTTDDATARLWRPTKGGDLRQVTLPPRTAHFLQAIEYVDARQIYVASALDGTLKVYDQELNELASIFTGRGTIVSMVYDGRHGRLLTGGVDGCAAWCLRGKPLANAESVLNPGYELAPIPQFFHRAIGKPPGSEPPAAGAASQKAAVAKTPKLSRANGAMITTTTDKGEALAARRRQPIAPNEISWVQSVQLNGEQTRLYAQGKHQIDVFSTADGHLIDSHRDLIAPEHGAITAFVVHEKTQYLVCGCMDGAIVVLSVHPTSTVHVFRDHTMSITSLAVHRSSHLIFSSSLDGTVRLWDLDARRQAHRLDIRQPVQALAILPPPTANPCRFYVRLRNNIRLFTVQSAAKEHLASLAPISIVQRVVPSLAPTETQSLEAVTLGGHANTATSTTEPRGRLDVFKRRGPRGSPTKNEASAPQQATPAAAATAASPGGAAAADAPAWPAQWVVAAGTDRTIRLFTGRAANEAPSFTWIPEERALDMSGFALRPDGRRLFLLLDSQKILVVSTRHQDQGPMNQETTPASTASAAAVAATTKPRKAVDRVVDMNALPSNPKNTTKSGKGSRVAGGRLVDSTSSLDAPTPSFPVPTASANTDSPSASNGTGNLAANPTIRGAVRSLCCCHYPPIFRSTAPAAVADASLKHFSRSFAIRRQQSKRELKRFDELTTNGADAGRPSSPRKRLFRSEHDWIACGTEFGHLIFWHTGLSDSFNEAICLDAHDAAVVAISASASTPLLVSLDATRRVNVWQFQPIFTLRQMIDLQDQPTCFVLAPTSETLLTGYEDGAVVFLNVSDALDRVETYASDDNNHDAMITAGDFLDAKQIVLTASVDAVIKIWDQQRNLLRQIQIAMAVTTLCFMNDDGDVMAGLTTGICVLPKDDVLPERLPGGVGATGSGAGRSIASIDEGTRGEVGLGTDDELTAASPSRQRPFWLETDENATERRAQSTSAPRPPALAKKHEAGLVLTKHASVSFEDAPESPLTPTPTPPSSTRCSPAGVQQPHARRATGVIDVAALTSATADSRVESSMSPTIEGISTVVALPRRTKMDELQAPLMTMINKPMTELHPPVLRPMQTRNQHHQVTHLTSSSSSSTTTTEEAIAAIKRPPSSRQREDVDWRDIITPLPPYRRAMAEASATHGRQRRGLGQSVGSSRASPTASMVTVDGGRVSRGQSPLAPRREEPPPTTPTATSEVHGTAHPLGIGLAEGETVPVQYCKHQAPVPAKAKTPRKLWNAVGGEDRRLLAVQRNHHHLPSL